MDHLGMKAENIKVKSLLHAFWISISFVTLWSCNSPSPSTLTRTETVVAETASTTAVPSVTPTQKFTLTNTRLSTRVPTKFISPSQTPIPTHTSKTKPNTTGNTTPTPLPTVKPTFNAYHLATATRSPAEACPEKNPNLKPPDFAAMLTFPPLVHHFQQNYLDYFNNGGIADALPLNWKVDYKLDLTNDGVSEYIFQQGDVFILGCQSGQDQLLLDIRENEDGIANRVIEARDANQNGFPEIILEINNQSQTSLFEILEWDAFNSHTKPYSAVNNTQFRSLWAPNDRHINKDGLFELLFGSPDFKFEALDLDPLLEVAVHIIPPYFHAGYNDGFPWRDETDYYKWNGSAYVFAKQVYDRPLFRFQAVNDGDWAFLRGEYDQAIQNYQQAIKDDNLYWYTEERRNFLLVNDPASFLQNATPVNPVYNPNEYPNLAAYSYFRMMLAEIKLGYPSRAQTIYDWLQANYTVDMPGYVYTELASLFWTEYQKSADFGKGCSAIYAFARLHPEEIFRYLATQIVSNKKLITWANPIHFGSQSAELEYSPAMICPSE